MYYAPTTTDDYTWSVDAASTDNDGLGIVFRVADANNFYKYSHNNEGSCRTLFKIKDGVRTELWQVSGAAYDAYTQSLDSRYKFTVVVQGCHFMGYFNSRDYDFNVTDADCVATGGVGVYSWGSDNAEWSNAYLLGAETTPSPTPSSPTPAVETTPSPTASPTLDAASGIGDPHLTNLRGEHFDIYQPGSMALIHLPRFAEPASTLLFVEAEAIHMGDVCSVYFQAVSISGSWTNQSTPIQFFADPHGTPGGDNRKNWMRFGMIDLKVVRRKKGVHYLNVYARNFSHSGYEVGGLLGLDDHKDVAKRPHQCGHRHAVSLVSSIAVVD
jgi:hypothetical protein